MLCVVNLKQPSVSHAFCSIKLQRYRGHDLLMPRDVICHVTIAASRGLPELTQNVLRSSHGHSTRSMKISCISVQPFTRNVADKEISIAASRGLPELTENVITSSHGHSTPSLKISCKSVSRLLVMLLSNKLASRHRAVYTN